MGRGAVEWAGELWDEARLGSCESVKWDPAGIGGWSPAGKLLLDEAVVLRSCQMGSWHSCGM